MKNYRFAYKSIIISLVSIILFLLVLSTALLTVVMINRSVKKKEARDPLYRYQSAIVDIKTNKTSLGFVSSHKKLEPEESMSYESEEGIHHLISNIGTTEYKCTGSCYCEEEIESSQHVNRRTTTLVVSNLMKRGLLTFVAATTASLAIRQAKKHFEEECRTNQILQSSCSSIKSEVDECNGVVVDVTVVLDIDQVKEQANNIGQRTNRHYKCEGRCLPKPEDIDIDPDDEDVELQELKQGFDCGRLLKKGEVVISFQDEIFAGKHDLAALEFQRIHLNPFCTKFSQYELLYERECVFDDEEEEEEKSILDRFFVDTRSRKINICKMRRGTLCVGSYEDLINPTVVCRLIDKDNWWPEGEISGLDNVGGEIDDDDDDDDDGSSSILPPIIPV